MFVDKSASASWQLATALMNAVCQPIYVIDMHRHLYFQNKHAEELLRSASLFRVSVGRLSCESREQTKSLQELVDELGMVNGSSSHLGPRVFLDRRSHAPYLASLAPVDFSSALPGRSALGLLILEERQVQPTINAKAMQALLGLSDAESRVANLIAHGGSVASVSDDLGILVSTVRSHLKAIFRKTGIRRQQDLIRLASSLSIDASRRSKSATN